MGCGLLSAVPAMLTQVLGSPFKMYIKRSFGMPTTLKKGTRTLEECQRLCRRESTCNGIQRNDGSCELLVDPLCNFETSFAAKGGQWTVQNRVAFDPELRRDAAKAVAPLPPVISTANYFQHQDSNVGTWGGVKLARVSVDPHITIFFRKVGGFGGALDIWLADSMPDNGAEWSNQPVQHKCLEWAGLKNLETKEAVCQGRGTHLILKPSHPSSARLEFARVLVKAPKILGTWCMESDTLFVSPEGSDDNKGSDASRPLLTVQHAVNVAADSGTTIRLGPGTFRGNELLPTGQIPIALADHIVSPSQWDD